MNQDDKDMLKVAVVLLLIGSAIGILIAYFHIHAVQTLAPQVSWWDALWITPTTGGGR